MGRRQGGASRSGARPRSSMFGTKSRSASSTASRPAPAPVSRPAAAAKPEPPKNVPAATTQTASAPAPQTSSGGGMGSGIMGTIAQGMAFGAGSEVAHQAVRSVIGGGGGGHHEPYEQQQQQQQPQQQYQAEPLNNNVVCGAEYASLESCLKSENPSDCQWLLDSFSECQRNAQNNKW